MTAATTLVGGDGEGSEGRTAGGKLTEWKGLKGSKAGVRREEKRGRLQQRGGEESGGAGNSRGISECERETSITR